MEKSTNGLRRMLCYFITAISLLRTGVSAGECSRLTLEGISNKIKIVDGENPPFLNPYLRNGMKTTKKDERLSVGEYTHLLYKTYMNGRNPEEVLDAMGNHVLTEMLYGIAIKYDKNKDGFIDKNDDSNGDGIIDCNDNGR